MKGRGGTPVPHAPAASKIQERRSRSDTPYQTPWRFTETPYNVEPALMKGRGGAPVPPAPAASNIQERRPLSDTPYQTPGRL
jgi:hypothetical protein